MINEFRKKPVVISAVQWTGKNEIEIMDFVGKKLKVNKPPPQLEHEKEIPDSAVKIHIPTLEGMMTADRGDWIIMGVNREFYPCKPDIFKKTYESSSIPSILSPEIGEGGTEPYWRCKEPWPRCPKQCPECAAQPTETPATGEDHVHIQLDNGAMATVKPNPSPELVNALNAMVDLAKKMPDRDSATGGVPAEVHPVFKGWDSERLIGRARLRFQELIHKGWEWKSFYNGWIEGRAEMLQQKRIDFDALQQEITQLKASLEESRNDAKVFQEWYKTGDANVIALTEQLGTAQEERNAYEKILKELFDALDFEGKSVVAPVLNKYKKISK